MSTASFNTRNLGPCLAAGSALAALLLLAFFLLQARPSLAQGDGYEQVQGYIERNSELLEWARDLVVETESVPARRILEEAFSLHQRSQQMLVNDRPINALALARRSRAALWRAVGLAREALSYEERLRLRGERFRDLHSHLLDLARENNDRQSLEFIHRAEVQGQRAREQFLQGDAKLAFKILEQAEQLLHRAARLLADGAGPERLDRDLERTANFLERTRESLNDNADPAALNLMAEADQALERAREHQDQGQPGRALQLSGLARKMAGRVRSMTSASPDQESVQVQLDRWDDLAPGVTEKVESSDSQPARRALDLARQHRRRAQEAQNQGDTDRALRQIRAAHDQLTQAEGLAR